MAMLFICYNTLAKTRHLQVHSGNASTNSETRIQKKIDFLKNINQTIMPSLWKHLRQHLAQ